MNQAQGIFITFEGPEGGGKSTQARLLADWFRRQGREVVLTREPGGTATGEAIRNILQHDAVDEDVDPRCEVLLFTACRAQLVARVIKPALARGAVVICDRFADSTVVYQGCGRGFGMDRMVRLNEFAIADTLPDATILLDLDVSKGFDRVHQRGADTGAQPDRFEREALEFHQRIRDGYLELARRWPERFRVIDASRDVDSVAADVRGALERSLGGISAGAGA